MYEHVAIGVVGIIGFEDVYGAAAVLHTFAYDGETVHHLAVALKQPAANMGG